MITKFKIFEKINELPKIGDYVLIDINNYKSSPKIWQDFIKNNIGEIIEINTEHGGVSNIYKIKFENVSDEIKELYLLKNGIRIFRIEDFKYWTSDKDELEILINSQKYNL